MPHDVQQTLRGQHPRHQRLLLGQLLDEQRRVYLDDPAMATALCSIGDRAPAEALVPIEVAAWATVVQAIQNSDATVWRR